MKDRGRDAKIVDWLDEMPPLHLKVLTGVADKRMINDMNGKTKGFEQSHEAILSLEVSDEALEAAASDTRPAAGAAMSFPNAPTVSILVMCCSNG